MGSWKNTRAQAIAQDLMAEIDNALGPASIALYSGTAPATVDDAVTGSNILLAQLGMSDPPFLDSPGDIAPGYRITADTITDDSSANASGTPTFGRIINAAGAHVFQFSVGGAGSGQEGIIVPTTITYDQPVAMTSLTITVPEA